MRWIARFVALMLAVPATSPAVEILLVPDDATTIIVGETLNVDVFIVLDPNDQVVGIASVQMQLQGGGGLVTVTADTTGSAFPHPPSVVNTATVFPSPPDFIAFAQFGAIVNTAQVFLARLTLTGAMEGSYDLVALRGAPGTVPNFFEDGGSSTRYDFSSDETITITVSNDLTDDDEDGIPNVADNCPAIPNSNQADTDSNGIGDACNDAEDFDGDEWADDLDNCPDDFNSDQSDTDGDLLGDICDPFPNDPDNEFAQCQADLDQCLADPAFTDSDGDGEEDSTDACPDTAPFVEVDDAGCSLDQFYTSIDATTPLAARDCKRADWMNDEPSMTGNERDCAVDKGGSGRGDDRCVAVP